MGVCVWGGGGEVGVRGELNRCGTLIAKVLNGGESKPNR